MHRALGTLLMTDPALATHACPGASLLQHAASTAAADTTRAVELFVATLARLPSNSLHEYNLLCQCVGLGVPVQGVHCLPGAPPAVQQLASACCLAFQVAA